MENEIRQEYLPWLKIYGEQDLIRQWALLRRRDFHHHPSEQWSILGMESNWVQWVECVWALFAQASLRSTCLKQCITLPWQVECNFRMAGVLDKSVIISSQQFVPAR